MIRGSLFRIPAINIALKKEAVNFKNIRYITCICRPPRKKFIIRQGKFFVRDTDPSQKLYLRFYSDYPTHFKVTLPALSPTMENGTIISWEKKEGDKLNEGDLLAEIETDKATMGFETPEEGYLAKILVPAGTKNVPIGKLVCIIVENEADVAAFKDFVDAEPAKSTSQQEISTPEKPSAISSSISAPQVMPPPTSSSEKKVFSSPLAKKLAAEQGIVLESVIGGSGIYGSIKSKDIANVQTSKASQIENQQFQDQPLSNIRSVIARRLVESKMNIPHYYLTVDVNIDHVNAIKEKINSTNEKEGIKLSLTDFIIKSLALSCKKVPQANSSWRDTFIRQYNTVDVSVAVHTTNGLITPIVYNADTKGIGTISADVKALAAKARDGKLQPHEYQGGTITVSNLGMFGINNFSAIVNPPQTCILAVGTSEKRVIPDSKNEKGFKIAEFISVTLSSDHRVLDGAVGAQFLSHFRQYLENPDLMLL